MSNRTAAVKLIVIIILVLLPTICFCDTIVLKSGKSLEGKLVEHNDSGYRIEDFHGVRISVRRELVQFIQHDVSASKPSSAPGPSATASAIITNIHVFTNVDVAGIGAASAPVVQER